MSDPDRRDGPDRREPPRKGGRRVEDEITQDEILAAWEAAFPDEEAHP